MKPDRIGSAAASGAAPRASPATHPHAARAQTRPAAGCPTRRSTTAAARCVAAPRRSPIRVGRWSDRIRLRHSAAAPDGFALTNCTSRSTAARAFSRCPTCTAAVTTCCHANGDSGTRAPTAPLWHKPARSRPPACAAETHHCAPRATYDPAHSGQASPCRSKGPSAPVRQNRVRDRPPAPRPDPPPSSLPPLATNPTRSATTTARGAAFAIATQAPNRPLHPAAIPPHHRAADYATNRRARPTHTQPSSTP